MFLFPYVRFVIKHTFQSFVFNKAESEIDLCLVYLSISQTIILRKYVRNLNYSIKLANKAKSFITTPAFINYKRFIFIVY